MAKLEFGCLPTAIGSMPHTDPKEACSLVMKYLPDIPAWPQLPQRSIKERMDIQFSEGFPGITHHEDKLYIEPSANFEVAAKQIQIDCQQNNLDKYAISAEYAAGLHAFVSQNQRTGIVKGQITGCITSGLTITKDDQSALYDETLSEAIAKFLRLKASWQEGTLAKISPNTIIFVDEPYLASLGSSPLVPDKKVVTLLEEVFNGIKGIKGIHCCGDTNWALLVKTSTDILSFDAYNYTASFSLYPDEVKAFLSRGGVIAWGIVPNNEENLSRETAGSLYDRLGEAMAPFTRNGIGFKQILRQSLLTPSCGLASLSPETACQALELVAKLSHILRGKYSV